MNITHDEIQSVIQLVALVSLFLVYRQLKVSREQLEQTAKWNKMRSFHDYFADVPATGTRTKLFEQLTKFDDANGTKVLDKVKQREAISKTEAVKLQSDADVSSAIYGYLDDYEELCGAIRAGIVDEDYAYSMDRTRICRTRTVFRAFIELLRDSDGGSKISCAYEELYQVADYLEKMSDEELQRIRNLRKVRRSL